MEASKIDSKKMRIRPLTKSEKLLLTLLGIVLIVYSSNRFILTPQAEKISGLELEKANLDAKIVDMNNTLKKEDNIKREWEVLHRERNEILANYFPVLDQPQIIYLLNDLLRDKGVEISDYSFNQPTTEQIGDMEVKQMSISLPYSAGYDGIVTSLNSIAGSPRRIIVDSLSMDRTTGTELDGNMSLKIYSLEGLAETDSEVIYVDVADGTGEGSLFSSFSGYNEGSQATDSSGSTSGVTGGSTEIDDADFTKVYMLHDFERRTYSFVPPNDMIKGDVSPSTIAKSGKYSLRFEYNMLALSDDNKAYIDISEANIELKYPADSVSMWVNAFGYSPGTLGMRYRTQGGDDIDVVMSEGISWLGWSSVEAAPPQDITLYPLTLTHLYFELPYDRDDFGVLLIDKLEANYPVNEGSASNKAPSNFFYVVEAGDTVTSISRKFYGSIAYKNEIMKNNSLTSGDLLPVGKILVLVRR